MTDQARKDSEKAAIEHVNARIHKAVMAGEYSARFGPLSAFVQARLVELGYEVTPISQRNGPAEFEVSW